MNLNVKIEAKKKSIFCIKIFTKNFQFFFYLFFIHKKVINLSIKCDRLLRFSLRASCPFSILLAGGKKITKK